MDSALQATILDWFQFREVCDDDKFPVFFERVLARDMTRYNQLLRIEPGISQYDWLVQNYKERKNEIDKSIRGSKSESSTLERVVSNATTSQKTTTYNTADQENAQGWKDVANSGSVVKDTDYGKRTVIDDDGSGSSTTRNTGTVSNAESEVANGTSNSSAKSMGKTAPQSISYAGTSGLPNTLDWANPSTQAESKGTESSNTASNSNSTRTDDTTSATNNSSSRDRAEQLSGSDTETTTNTTARNETDVENKTHAKTGTVTDATTRGGNVSTDEEGSKNTIDSTSEGTVDKEQETGRNIDIATLLSNAKRFIISSNAWEWLANQLEVCFFGIYD